MPTSSIHQRPFGQLPDGQTVDEWTLRGAGGLELEVLTYGGIVRRLVAPDRHGQLDDLALGYDDLTGYLTDQLWLGAVAGRIAGRVTNAQLSVEGTTYELPQNNGNNHLHGGETAINRRIWSAQPIERADGEPSLRLSLRSPDGDLGYPGAVDLCVTFTVTADNTFIFETEAHSDRATPISLTHHGYFNLAGHDTGVIDACSLQVHCDTSIPFATDGTLSDQKIAVDGTASDLRTAKPLRAVIPHIPHQHGDLYWLGESQTIRPVAHVTDPTSGRTLSVSTDLPCLQTFFGSILGDGIIGKNGTTHKAFGAFCLECQGYPNASNLDDFGDILVRPDQPQHTTTRYQFGIQD